MKTVKKIIVHLCSVVVCFVFVTAAPAQIITTVYGTGGSGYSGDGGPASAATYTTGNIVFDHTGNLFLDDIGNYRVRIINTGGIINTYAGDGTRGFYGDGGPATAAKFSTSPGPIAIDGAGNIYIADSSRIRKIGASSGIITSIAGSGTRGPSMGDGGPATAAQFNILFCITVDAVGNLYIVDHAYIRKVDLTGTISTIAGAATFGFAGDGGPATAAQFSEINGMITDPSGNLFVCDVENNRIRKIDASGIINTIAGSGATGSGHGGFSGDGGPATTALMYSPGALAIDQAGNLYAGDGSRIRKISPSGIITTVAGTSTAGYSGDDGPATAANVNAQDMAFDCAGNLYIEDGMGHIRKITFHDPPAFTLGTTQSISVCENSSALAIDSLLGVTDTSIGRTETWNVTRTPVHGTMAGAFSTISTGSVLSPTGFSYTPTIGYIGNDTVSMQVLYCGTTAGTTTFYITRRLNGSDIKASTIARGISVGGELEYADEITLGRSILGRVPYKL